VKRRRHSASHRLRVAAALALLAGASTAATANAATATYTLENVWLLPDITHPWEPARQMTGTFEWTYAPGDFENGSGQFTDLYIPWTASPWQDLNITIDLTSLEFVLPGNWHDRGLDLTLFLLEPLSLDQAARIDTVRSLFEIQEGIIYRGHAISGAVAPPPGLSFSVGGTCPFDVQVTVANATPSGPVALLYAFAEGGFVLPGTACVGTVLGLDDTAALGMLITADSTGTATLNTAVPAGACGNVFLQALDPATCATSNVVPLP
jgi:hypothetical protein